MECASRASGNAGSGTPPAPIRGAGIRCGNENIAGSFIKTKIRGQKDGNNSSTRLLQPLLPHADMTRPFRTIFRRVTPPSFRMRRDGDYDGAASWVSGGESTSVTREKIVDLSMARDS